MELGNYLFWPRQCKACGGRRKLRTLIVEVSYIVAFILMWRFPSENTGFIVSTLLVFYYGLVSIIDLEHRVILHGVSLIGFILGMIVGIELHGWLPTALGGLAGFGFMLIVYYLGIWFVKLSKHWRKIETSDDEGIGFGDVNLSGVLGLMLGWPGVIAGLVLAILIGGGASFLYLILALIGRKYRPTLALPFGPFIAASALILLLK